MSRLPCTDHSLEARLLSAVLRRPDALTALGIQPDDATLPVYVKALRAAHRLCNDGVPISHNSVIEAMREEGSVSVDEVGQILEATELYEPDLEGVAVRARNLSKARRLRESLLRAVSGCESGRITDAERLVLAAAESIRDSGQNLTATAYEVQRDAAADLLAKVVETKRVPTGIDAIDRVIGFVSPGDLIIIGADTGVGKTSVLMSMAEYQAVNGHTVGFISCEDGRTVLGSRLIGLRSGVSSRRLRSGKLEKPDFAAIEQAIEKSKDMGLHFAFEIGSNEMQVQQAMTRLVRNRGCTALMVDYIQTINPTNGYGSRREDVRMIASKLKGTAARLDVPLFLTSQLSRPPADKRAAGRVPTKHDLKEAGDLENMAELVLLLWREHDPAKPSHELAVNGVVAKSKWGGDGQQWRMFRDGGGSLREDIDWARAAS